MDNRMDYMDGMDGQWCGLVWNYNMVSQNPFKIAVAVLQITMSTMLGWIWWRMGISVRSAQLTPRKWITGYPPPTDSWDASDSSTGTVYPKFAFWTYLSAPVTAVWLKKQFESEAFVTPHTCHALKVPPPADNNMAECVKRRLSLHNARQHQLQPYQQAEIQIVSWVYYELGMNLNDISTILT